MPSICPLRLDVCMRYLLEQVAAERAEQERLDQQRVEWEARGAERIQEDQERARAQKAIAVTNEHDNARALTLSLICAFDGWLGAGG